MGYAEYSRKLDKRLQVEKEREKIIRLAKIYFVILTSIDNKSRLLLLVASGFYLQMNKIIHNKEVRVSKKGTYLL